MTTKYPAPMCAVQRYQPKELYPLGEYQKPSVGFFFSFYISWFLIVSSAFFFYMVLVMGFIFCCNEAFRYFEMIPPAQNKYTNLLLCGSAFLFD